MESASLIIFIKNPELGKVKTRIAKTAGDKIALKIYNKLLKHTREIVSKSSLNRFLYYSDFVDEHDEWSKALFHKKLQPRGNLGEKMTFAFKDVMTVSSPTIIIGSDCALLSTKDLDKAVTLLTSNDIVIGPTFDGGYYLLGMNKYHEQLFQNISWSTENVYDQTILKANELGLSIGVLKKLADIDHESDWLEWGW